MSAPLKAIETDEGFLEAEASPKSWSPKALRNWHDAMLDDLVIEPAVTLKELAVRYGVSEQAVGMVVRSDMFQQRLRERREILHAVTDRTVGEKVQRVAGQALDNLHKRLANATAFGVTMDQELQTAEMALKALGYGATPSGKGASASMQVNVVVSANELAAARLKMGERQNELSGPTIDAAALPAAE